MAAPTAFVFPGQGSQAPGMGKALAEAYPSAREAFEEVDDALSVPLSRLIFTGDADELTLTANAQPALLAVSIAALRVIQAESGFDFAAQARFAAGHSLGEYTALTAAGTFTLADAARLVRARGLAMQQAVPPGEGAMAALLGLTPEQAAAVAEEAAQGQICAAANDNADGQIVISGHTEAVERAIEIAKAQGAKRAMRLPVSAPFHCALMAPAAEVMAEKLAETVMNDPVAPVMANVTAAPVIDAETARDLLVQQVTGAVRWRESVLAMRAAGVERQIEIGAGKVLSGLARRIDPDLQTMNAGTPEEIEAVLAAL
ncbi:MAG: ACP S-malonyltransferase [Rhodospirillales bacterium]